LAGLRSINAQKVIGIGHSMGGVATMTVAIRQPELFDRIVLVDPTLLPPVFLRKVNVMKWFGMKPRIDLIQGALKRRRQWDSQEQAYQLFKEKNGRTRYCGLTSMV
jgi:pimeloyl-ACP methyl ester carboxylesterase